MKWSVWDLWSSEFEHFSQWLLFCFSVRLIHWACLRVVGNNNVPSNDSSAHTEHTREDLLFTHSGHDTLNVTTCRDERKEKRFMFLAQKIPSFSFFLLPQVVFFLHYSKSQPCLALQFKLLNVEYLKHNLDNKWNI